MSLILDRLDRLDKLDKVPQQQQTTNAKQQTIQLCIKSNLLKKHLKTQRPFQETLLRISNIQPLNP